VSAATITVSDSCTLVDAITAANTDTATGGCPAGSGADTIVLPPGSTQTLYGPTGLMVGSPITIVGQGSTITRAGAAPDFRIFVVSKKGALTLQETAVSGGRAGNGGGLANSGTLTITNSTLRLPARGGQATRHPPYEVERDLMLPIPRMLIRAVAPAAMAGGLHTPFPADRADLMTMRLRLCGTL